MTKATEAVKPNTTEDIPVVATVPFTSVSPRKQARMAARALLADEQVKTTAKNKSKKQSDISNQMIAQLINLADAGVDNKKEILQVLDEYNVTPEKIAEVRKIMVDEPLRFRTDAHPIRLESLGTVPEANRPQGFSAPPGTPAPDADARYFPNRFAVLPNNDDYENGDIVYSVHEDNSYTVLSVLQQTKEFQTVNHMPAMNFLYRIGGDAADEVPKKVEKKNAEV